MPQPPWIDVSLSRQRLTLQRPGGEPRVWPISTAAAGAGEREGSAATPRGWHRIRLCIGAGQPEHAVFVGRRPTGEVYSEQLRAAAPERDWILTRILWLTGSEPGRNRGGNVDTLRRFIYIHGTADEATIGQPVSAGCIRMRNADLLALFPECRPGMPVRITESS